MYRDEVEKVFQAHREAIGQDLEPELFLRVVDELISQKVVADLVGRYREMAPKNLLELRKAIEARGKEPESAKVADQELGKPGEAVLGEVESSARPEPVSNVDGKAASRVVVGRKASATSKGR